MATNDFSLGRATSIVLTHPLAQTAGGRVDLQHVTGFHATQTYNSPKVDRLDGVTLSKDVPKGWTFTIDIERGNQQVDLLQSAVETAWYTLGTAPYGSMTQYTQEQDGSVSTYQYDNVSLKIDSGDWKDDAAVKQKITGTASRRRQV
jgi:hypothetical protein